MSDKEISLQDRFDEIIKDSIEMTQASNSFIVLEGIIQLGIIVRLWKSLMIPVSFPMDKKVKKILNAYPEMRHWTKIEIDQSIKDHLRREEPE